MKIILNGERPCSWNKFYSGMHWKKRQEEAERVHELVKYETYGLINRQGFVKRFTEPVNITVIAYFDKNLQDADNIASKLYVDGLKYFLLEDDNPKWVRSVKTESRVDKHNPRVEIVIEKTNEQ